MGKIDFCAHGKAYGFSLKVQPYQGKAADDTSLNGIRLYCDKGGTAQSAVGPWGEWTEIEKCPKRYLVSFALQVELPQGPGDDTAANNIQFICGDGTRLPDECPNYGTYGPWSKRCKAGAICGIQTKVEATDRKDATGLNDVKFYCCD